MTTITERVQARNDAVRIALTTNRIDFGTLFITPSVETHGYDFVMRALSAVQRFDDFADETSEHDCGTFELDGVRLSWKIDYSDRELNFGAPVIGDALNRYRLLTIRLAEEY